MSLAITSDHRGAPISGGASFEVHHAHRPHRIARPRPPTETRHVLAHIAASTILPSALVRQDRSQAIAAIVSHAGVGLPMRVLAMIADAGMVLFAIDDLLDDGALTLDEATLRVEQYTAVARGETCPEVAFDPIARARCEEPGARVIVLATDGEPDSCAQPDPMTTTERNAARAGSVAAVQAAFRDGIRTFVISVGSDVSEAHLRELANAGAGTTTGRFYRASNPAALTAAFREITVGVRSCVFRLNGTVSDAATGDVRLDGAPLTLGAPDGWSLRSPSEIELRGAACERARTTSSSLTARFPCGVVTPG
jgi:hypothetical protein